MGGRGDGNNYLENRNRNNKYTPKIERIFYQKTAQIGHPTLSGYFEQFLSIKSILIP